MPAPRLTPPSFTASTDATLESLNVDASVSAAWSTIPLTPAFDPAGTSYELGLVYADKICVSAVPSSERASVALPSDDGCVAASNVVPLTLSVVVTAEDSPPRRTR